MYGAASVDALSMTVDEVLTQRFPIAVPRYQRAYAWDDEAVGHFVSDIEAMLSYGAGSASHFFGGVVCILHTDHLAARPTSYEVVDGQQRLATLMLALACVARVAEDLAERCKSQRPEVTASAETLRDTIVENSLTWKYSNVAAGTVTARRRMTLSAADDHIFGALVMGEAVPAPKRESHEWLIGAHAALLRMVEDFVGVRGPFQKRLEKLIRLQHALLHDAHVIHIVSKERSQAYRLFSVLNHRGESLSDADLLRSRSLELLEEHPKIQETTAQFWDELLSYKARDVELFFQAIYPSVTGKRALGDLFEALETKFFPDIPTNEAEAKKVRDTVEWFRDEFLLYQKLAEGKWPFSHGDGRRTTTVWQRTRLRRLTVTLRHDLALPMLLAAARSLSERDFAELVFMLEIFAFRYKIICGAHATRPANLYYAHAKTMRSATSGNPYHLKALRAELRTLLEKKAGDTLFVQLLHEKLRYSNSSQRVNIREFLTLLEDHKPWLERPGSKQKGARPRPSMNKVIDIDEATLEHIYPQNAAASDKDASLESRKHELGNLTFFGPRDNSSTGNKPFVTKRDISYAPSDIRMTSALAALGKWTDSELSDRQKSILADAVRVFVI